MKVPNYRQSTIVVVIVATTLLASLSFAIGKVSSNPEDTSIGIAVEPFLGIHQSGISTPRQADLTLLAFDLRPETDVNALGRLMRVWTGDTAQATQGREVISDPNPGMEEFPARITATFGFGYSLFKKLHLESKWPIARRKIPSYSIDQLESKWSDGDIVVQIAGDDQISIYHLAYLLKRDAAPFATIRYQQRGFQNAAGVNSGNTGRNLLGQLDGTLNPKPGTHQFEAAVWSSKGLIKDGTSMVVRRIRFNVQTWDRLSINRKGEVSGRKLLSGAPLSGGNEKSELKLTSKDNNGKYLIPKNSHVALALTPADKVIFRRGFNYDDGYLENGTRDAGLIFISFQANLESYIAIQSALAKNDSLNTWTTPVGSSLFVVPGGLSSDPSDWIGKKLLNE